MVIGVPSSPMNMWRTSTRRQDSTRGVGSPCPWHVRNVGTSFETANVLTRVAPPRLHTVIQARFQVSRVALRRHPQRLARSPSVESTRHDSAVTSTASVLVGDLCCCCHTWPSILATLQVHCSLRCSSLLPIRFLCTAVPRRG